MKPKKQICHLFSLLLLFLSTNVLAQGVCPWCGINNNFGATPFYGGFGFYGMPSFYQQPYMPWYSPFGGMSYSNFYYPSPWAGGGMDMSFFPGGGHGGMGKPNLYISGPAGTLIHVQVQLPKESTLLAAVPIHGANGWTGMLEGNGSISSQGVSYPYFFYDLRMNEDSLQAERGFCVGQDSLISKLTEVLEQKGFKPNEVKDFREYWSVKMPLSQKYCVFPQENLEMDTIAKLQITPAPARVTRVGFMIVIAEGLVQSTRKFTREPSQPWKETKDLLASENTQGIQIREWGVGFVEDVRSRSDKRIASF